LVEGALVEGALVEGALVEGALVEGALVEGALVEGGRMCERTWSGERVKSRSTCMKARKISKITT
jgi:hypothetical protein